MVESKMGEGDKQERRVVFKQAEGNLVGGLVTYKKVRREVDGVRDLKTVTVGEGGGKAEENRKAEGVGGVTGSRVVEGQKKVSAQHVSVTTELPSFHFNSVYHSTVEDRKWAYSGMTASVIGGTRRWLFNKRSTMPVFQMWLLFPWGVIKFLLIVQEVMIYGM
jgi:hypothetical protein